MHLLAILQALAALPCSSSMHALKSEITLIKMQLIALGSVHEARADFPKIIFWGFFHALTTSPDSIPDLSLK